MTEIIDRKTAIAIGLDKYFTGKPCCNGHVDKRSSLNGSCASCALERSRRYYQEHIEKNREKGRVLYARNREKYRDRVLRYRLNNMDKIRENNRKANQKFSAMRAAFKQLGITIPEINDATR